MPKKEDTIKKYIDYWDEVIRQWLQYNADYKSFTGDAAEQRQIIEAINSKVGKDSDYRLNIQHMPEPYWGNPRECSIVLLDYNPAGGAEISRHTSINCKDCAKCGKSFINIINSEYLYNNGYSNFALNGPIFQSEEEIKHNNLGWFSDKDNGYGGYHWWQEKKKWIDHLVAAICGNIEGDYSHPFCMELCGWHSKKWSNNMSWIEKGECHEIVNRRLIQPLFASMKNSLWNHSPKIAACIGAQLNPIFFKKIFNNIERTIFINITPDLGFKKDKDYIYKQWMEEKEGKEITFKCIVLSQGSINRIPKISKETKESIAVKVVTIKKDKNNKQKEESATRYYRIYNIVNDKGNHIILNTFAPGGNHHPAEHFWPFEKELINVIKEYYKKIKQ